jgi:uncharacterized protein (TIGR02145 family)
MAGSVQTILCIMISSVRISVKILIIIISVIITYSCQKDEPMPPAVTTSDPVEITQTTVTAGGNITSDGGAEIKIAGVCWSTSHNPSVKDQHSNDSKTPGSFTSNLTGLTPNTTYYLRAYANNMAGTAYGEEVSFTTSQITLATINTSDILSITAISATSGGNITSDGGDPVTERGVCWSTDINPTVDDSKTSDGSGPGNYESEITNLQPVTTYYVRAYATNVTGTAYGNEISFSTLASAPVITTSDVTSITTYTAKSGGTVISDGGGGSVTERGLCWSVIQNPTTDDNITEEEPGLGPFTSNLIDLKANTTYYLRAYAINATGTGYGNEVIFTTGSDTIVFNQSVTYGTVRDIDGNIYRTVEIGLQTWMAENLKTTSYKDGQPIPRIMDDAVWQSDEKGAYCHYNNEFSNKYLYGALYNWHAVNTGLLCPDGWHVPTDIEWTILTDFLDGEIGAGGKLKEVETTHWNSPNSGATNETGFTALPGGSRHSTNGFYYLGSDGYWWTSTESPGNLAYYRYLFSGDPNMRTYDSDQKNGYSVRCVKD